MSEELEKFDDSLERHEALQSDALNLAVDEELLKRDELVSHLKYSIETDINSLIKLIGLPSVEKFIERIPSLLIV